MNAPANMNEAMDLIRSLAIQLKEREIKDAIAAIEAKWAPLISGIKAVTPVVVPEPVAEPKLEPTSIAAVPVVQAAYELLQAQGETADIVVNPVSSTAKCRVKSPAPDTDTVGFCSVPANRYVRSNFAHTQESFSYLGRVLSRISKARGLKTGCAKGAGGKSVNTYAPEAFDALQQSIEKGLFEEQVMVVLRKHMRRAHA